MCFITNINKNIWVKTQNFAESNILQILKTNQMQKLKLIEGEFTSEEFKEVLSNLYSNKIKFYERKDFSSLIRSGENDLIAIKKIDELNQSVKQFLEIFSRAKTNNQKLIVLSEVQIIFKNPEIFNKKNI